MIDPVIYTVRIEHWADGTLITKVEGIASEEKDRESAAWALRQAADSLLSNANPEITQ